MPYTGWMPSIGARMSAVLTGPVRSMVPAFSALLLVLWAAVPAHAASYEVRMQVQWDHGATQDAGFNASASPPVLDPVESVRLQLQAPGLIGLQIPNGSDGNFSPALPHLQEAARHKDRIKWVYVFDEMFWSQGHIVIGYLEPQITQAALTVKAHGMKSVISMLAEVILDRAFVLQNPNAFDVIAIDVYPSGGVGSRSATCAFNDNPYTTMLSCALQKLRGLGYTGQVWYAYQSFGSSRDPDLAQHLVTQRIAIEHGPYIGITGLISFGYHMPVSAETPFYGLRGTALDPLVNCITPCGAGL
jgi:hypothetical protein